MNSLFFIRSYKIGENSMKIVSLLKFKCIDGHTGAFWHRWAFSLPPFWRKHPPSNPKNRDTLPPPGSFTPPSGSDRAHVWNAIPIIYLGHVYLWNLKFTFSWLTFLFLQYFNVVYLDLLIILLGSRVGGPGWGKFSKWFHKRPMKNFNFNAHFHNIWNFQIFERF